MPPALRAIRGNPGHRPARPELVIPAGAPTPPEWLDGEARREWDLVTPVLAEARLATALDRAALIVHCTLWERWRMLDAIVRREGFTIKTRTGTRIHPVFKASLDVAAALRLTGAELGLSPSARSRLRAPSAPPPLSRVDLFRQRHGDRS